MSIKIGDTITATVRPQWARDFPAGYDGVVVDIHTSHIEIETEIDGNVTVIGLPFKRWTFDHDLPYRKGTQKEIAEMVKAAVKKYEFSGSWLHAMTEARNLAIDEFKFNPSSATEVVVRFRAQTRWADIIEETKKEKD